MFKKQNLGRDEVEEDPSPGVERVEKENDFLASFFEEHFEAG